MGWFFELYQNDYDEHVFTLIDGADVTMLQGAGYVQEANAMKSIDLIRTNAGCDACYEPSCLASIIFAGRRQLSLPVFLFLFFIHLLSSAIASTF